MIIFCDSTKTAIAATGCKIPGERRCIHFAVNEFSYCLCYLELKSDFLAALPYANLVTTVVLKIRLEATLIYYGAEREDYYF